MCRDCPKAWYIPTRSTSLREFSATGGNTHEHVWTLGRIEVEAVGYLGARSRVAYLYCQCGAVKRTVPE